MSRINQIRKMLEASKRDVDLPASGWQVRVRRANAYQFMATSIPLGTMLQNLARAATAIATMQDIDDELACKLNEDAPRLTELYQLMVCQCVQEMQIDDAGWVKVQVHPDDVPEEELGDDGMYYDAFIRSMDPEDVGALQSVLWELNGLGKGVAAAFGPFCPDTGGADLPAGEDSGEVSDAGDEGTGSVRTEPEPGDRSGGTDGRTGTGSEEDRGADRG